MAAEASRDRAAKSFAEAGYDQLTTEIVEAGPFWFAEELHQQYLEKVPNGYCPIHSTGVKCG